MRKKTRTRTRYRLRNWRDYNAALVRRGSLTLWCDEAALAGWVERAPAGDRRRRGRPRTYSDLAITCMLTLAAVYRLPLRAAQGLTRSLLALLRGAGAAALPAAHYATLSRRAARLAVALPVRRPAGPMHLVVDSTGLKVYGEGEWKVRLHGWTKHRRWLKLHLGADATPGGPAEAPTRHELRAVGLSTNAVTDGQMLPGLLAAEPAALAAVIGDGIYDEWRCWDAVAARPERPRAVFPPPRPRTGPRRARIRQHGNSKRPPLARDEHLRRIRAVGRAGWKREAGYHRRSLAETAVFRWKALFGDRVRARTFARQATEVFVKAAALNRMTRLGMPDSYAVAPVA